MTRTYLDSGVLIEAIRRDVVPRQRIAQILADPDRTYVSSVFVRLEVLPKAIYHKRADEVGWFEAFFASVIAWADATPGLIEHAEQIARQHGLNALDTLHVAAAVALGADELVTTERPTRPIHRATGVAVVAL